MLKPTGVKGGKILPDRGGQMDQGVGDAENPIAAKPVAKRIVETIDDFGVGHALGFWVICGPAALPSIRRR